MGGAKGGEEGIKSESGEWEEQRFGGRVRQAGSLQDVRPGWAACESARQIKENRTSRTMSETISLALAPKDAVSLALKSAARGPGTAQNLQSTPRPNRGPRRQGTARQIPVHGADSRSEVRKPRGKPTSEGRGEDRGEEGRGRNTPQSSLQFDFVSAMLERVRHEQLSCRRRCSAACYAP
eukprot:9486266-Pyramimonas_sp.AAC.1